MNLTPADRALAASFAGRMPLEISEDPEAVGHRIVDTCHALAARQYHEDELGAARCEIELLRTKVLELVRREIAHHG